MIRKNYTVSQDKRGYWYAHTVNAPDIPILGTYSRSAEASMRAADKYMGVKNERGEK